MKQIAVIVLGIVLAIPKERITGGTTGSIYDEPFLVSIHHKQHFICSGAIITKNFILTTARCTQFASANQLTIRAGSSYYDYDGMVVTVSKYTNHPNYSAITNEHDISVLQLVEDLPFYDAIQPIPLDYLGDFIISGAVGILYGWGATSNGGSSSPLIQEVKLKVINDADCYFANSMTVDTFCMEAVREDTGPCERDWGGPVVMNNTLVGLFSDVLGCGLTYYHGLYSRIDLHLDFINETTGILADDTYLDLYLSEN